MQILEGKNGFFREISDKIQPNGHTRRHFLSAKIGGYKKGKCRTREKMLDQIRQKRRKKKPEGLARANAIRYYLYHCYLLKGTHSTLSAVLVVVVVEFP